MAAKAVDVDAFLSSPGALFDVRSPAEYAHARIPGACSLPLFSNDERARVGTLYKQAGHDEAVMLGLEIVGPKLASLALQARQGAFDGYAKAYCWRGGMRSGSMAWLMDTAGLHTLTLKGGYKAFRRWVLANLQLPAKLRLLGGLTGSGKTRMLQILKVRGEQVLDLEALACHRGSAFGSLGMPVQPSNEQLENELAWQWSRFDLSRPIWVEDESRMIGCCKVPDALFAAMRRAPMYIIDRPVEERLDRLLNDYALLDAKELLACVQKLAGKLGRERVGKITALILEGEMRQAMQLVVGYYDTAYRYGVERRQQPVIHLAGDAFSDEQWAEQLLSIKD